MLRENVTGVLDKVSEETQQTESFGSSQLCIKWPLQAHLMQRPTHGSQGIFHTYYLVEQLLNIALSRRQGHVFAASLPNREVEEEGQQEYPLPPSV